RQARLLGPEVRGIPAQHRVLELRGRWEAHVVGVRHLAGRVLLCRGTRTPARLRLATTA
ncbi:unnamed protein product, partial [Prorocentrum cordatum]